MAENRVSGWAIRYNEPTVIAGSFVERIAPGAFAGAMDDVLLLWSHANERPLARTTSGTLVLRDEGRMGVWFSADLDPSSPDAALALSSIGRRDTRGMSFGFRVRKEEWREPSGYDELPERTILQAELLEISAVVWPAYPQADVAIARSDNRSAALRRIALKAQRAHHERGIV